MISVYIQLYVVIGVTYSAFRLVMFGSHEDDLRPSQMPRSRFVLAAAVAALLGGLLWPLTFAWLIVRALWNKRRRMR